MSLIGKKVLFGISAGIAAYKTPDIIRGLIALGAEVRTIVSPNALKIVTAETLCAVSENPVLIDTFSTKNTIEKGHIEVADWADIFVCAPATAGLLSRFANGTASDLISTTYLAVKCPILIFPSMNTNMYSHPAVTANIKRLKSYGNIIIDADSGKLACGYSGKGRLPNKERILFETEKVLTKKTLKNLKVVVTSGGTSENIDAVRVITNSSSGKMGVSLALDASKKGAEVTLIKTHNSISPNTASVFKVIEIKSALELSKALKKEISNADILIMAAAVSDYTPLKPLKQKQKRISGENLILELKPTEDILASIKQKGLFKVGFCLETEKIEQKAIEKLFKKGLDLIVANSTEALGAENSSVSIIDKQSKIKRHRGSKIELSDIINNLISKKFN